MKTLRTLTLLMAGLIFVATSSSSVDDYHFGSGSFSNEMWINNKTELWGISEKTVRNLFEGEEGVLRWGRPETLRKRGYYNLRIPESVLIRVHHRRQTA